MRDSKRHEQRDSPARELGTKMNANKDPHFIPLHEIRVLYVDDDTMSLDLVERLLTRTGYQVECVADPTQALSVARSRPFHIVLADYHMPGMTGVEFFEQLRPIFASPYRVMLTGMIDFDVIHSAVNRAGVHRYITKPFHRREFLSVVEDATQHARLLLQNERLRAELAAQNHELVAVNKALDRLVEKRTLNVLNALVAALDYRDTETHWHSRRVALFARMIAQQMNITGEELFDIELGALLHDVGKIGISDNIVMKPGKLTEDEWVEMRKHPQLGYDLLRGIDFLEEARTIVLHHHERWDGCGYPQRLPGPEITVGARIFAVCDTLDAMTSDRPYRKALSYDIAKEEILACAGSQFDPDVVEAFVRVGNQRWREAIAAGHVHEELGDDGLRDIDRVLRETARRLPEIGSAIAWQTSDLC